MMAAMYSKTNPQAAGQLSARQKRILLTVSVTVIVVLGGLGIWGALAHDGYSTSAHGCVSVTVPGSTGGATLHYCGQTARSFCQTAFTSDDAVSLRARPQCVLAGLKP
jgi:hypothetical protein